MKNGNKGLSLMQFISKYVMTHRDTENIPLNVHLAMQVICRIVNILIYFFIIYEGSFLLSLDTSRNIILYYFLVFCYQYKNMNGGRSSNL